MIEWIELHPWCILTPVSIVLIVAIALEWGTLEGQDPDGFRFHRRKKKTP